MSQNLVHLRRASVCLRSAWISVVVDTWWGSSESSNVCPASWINSQSTSTLGQCLLTASWIEETLSRYSSPGPQYVTRLSSLLRKEKTWPNLSTFLSFLFQQHKQLPLEAQAPDYEAPVWRCRDPSTFHRAQPRSTGWWKGWGWSRSQGQHPRWSDQPASTLKPFFCFNQTSAICSWTLTIWSLVSQLDSDSIFTTTSLIFLALSRFFCGTNNPSLM